MGSSPIPGPKFPILQDPKKGRSSTKVTSIKDALPHPIPINTYTTLGAHKSMVAVNAAFNFERVKYQKDLTREKKKLKPGLRP
ncbi:hypothetical protein AVEN_110644-1 [Araneus ventricosus]|uniref:Uncharacterized protein n=1 Tax=Araneus ventricosus TaxID=182803 RepID=A0A4Y2AW60_ARAVE|nr:hypothetical protein AVEN_110644-1 [Araneus ventricosus]